MVTTATAEPVVRLRCELGEGPLWDHRSGHLLWVDILGGLVHWTVPSSGVVTTVDAGRHVGAVALSGPDTSGYLLAVRDGFAPLIDKVVGERQVAFDDPAVRMNDGAVDPAGRFLAGTMAYDFTPGAGTLYTRDPDGTVRALVDGVTVSNGLAWSDDGYHLYYADSSTGGVDKFDYDVEHGTVTNRRRHITVDPADGVPDGLTLDTDGCCWLALFGAGRVHRYAPDGQLIDHIDVPAAKTTSCAFGGSGLDTLFITTAAEGADLSDPANALAGYLFAADPGSGCTGRLEPIVPPPG